MIVFVGDNVCTPIVNFDGGGLIYVWGVFEVVSGLLLNSTWYDNLDDANVDV